MKQQRYQTAAWHYLLGTLLSNLVMVLALPIFTRLLSTSEYGIVSTYISWVVIISIVIGFALHMGVRSFFVDTPDDIDNFMATVATFILLNAFFWTLIFYFLLYCFDYKIDPVLPALCSLQATATAIMLSYSQYLMLKVNFISRTLLIALPNILSIIFSVYVISFFFDEKPYMGRIVPTAVVHVVFMVICLVSIYSKTKTFFCKKHLAYGLKITTPLILHGISLNILAQSDRTMITLLADASQTGIYSLVYNFSNFTTLITTSLSGAWLPWFFDKIKENQYCEINRVSKEYISLITNFVLIMILGSPEVLHMLADKRYWAGQSIMAPLVLSSYIVFLYTFYVNVEHYYKKTMFITICTMIAAVVNIVLNICLIPHYGYEAAAFTTFIAYLISLILHWRFAKKIEPRLFMPALFKNSLTILLVVVVMFYVFERVPLIRWALIATISIFSLSKVKLFNEKMKLR